MPGATNSFLLVEMPFAVSLTSFPFMLLSENVLNLVLLVCERWSLYN